MRPRQPDTAGTSAALVATLEAARSFAAREFPSWTEWFERALAATTPAFHPDLVSPAFPEPARRLAAMASHAWVFGGMGSWNDIGFESTAVQSEHRDISRVLYVAIIQAVVAAVNCDLG